MADFNEELANSLNGGTPPVTDDPNTPPTNDDPNADPNTPPTKPEAWNPLRDEDPSQQPPVTPPAKPTDDEEEDDEDVVDKKYKNLEQQLETERTERKKMQTQMEIQSFLNDPKNAEFKKHEEMVKKMSAMPGLDRLKIKSLFYAAAGDDLTYIIANQVKNANRTSNNTVVNAPKTQSKGAVDFNAMDTKTFQEYRRQVEQGIIKPGQPMKKIA